MKACIVVVALLVAFPFPYSASSVVQTVVEIEANAHTQREHSEEAEEGHQQGPAPINADPRSGPDTEVPQFYIPHVDQEMEMPQFYDAQLDQDMEVPQFYDPQDVMETRSTDTDANTREQGPTERCGQIIQTLSPLQAREFFYAIVDKTVNPNTSENFLIKFTLRGHIRYGVQVRKICGSCAEYRSMHSTEAFLDFCGPDVYGSDDTLSGLLIAPVVYSSYSGLKIKPGTLPGFVYSRPSRTESFMSVPSEDWKQGRWWGADYTYDAMVGFIAAASGSAVIMPDYMGYGESAILLAKSYAVKRSYQTSTIPLWLKAGTTIGLETNCASALADAAVLVGYGDGGFASIAVADGLSSSLGVDIISVQAGGAPLRMGSLVLSRLIRSIDERDFPSSSGYILAMFGSAYSSTNPSVANFGRGVDLLSPSVKTDLVAMLEDGYDVDSFNSFVSQLEHPSEIFDERILSWIRAANENDISDPCLTNSTGLERLCKALDENDLSDTLKEADYPVRLCFSEDDPVTDIDNLPEFRRNRRLLTLIPTRGDHTKAGRYCLLQALLFLSNEDYTSHKVTAKHSPDGCFARSASVENKLNGEESQPISKSSPSTQSDGLSTSGTESTPNEPSSGSTMIDEAEPITEPRHSTPPSTQPSPEPRTRSLRRGQLHR